MNSNLQFSVSRQAELEEEDLWTNVSFDEPRSLQLQPTLTRTIDTIQTKERLYPLPVEFSRWGWRGEKLVVQRSMEAVWLLTQQVKQKWEEMCPNVLVHLFYKTSS